MEWSSIRKVPSRGANADMRTLILAAAAGFGLCLFLLGRLALSGFSILDDHQIIAWIHTDLWSRIASTEVVHFGTSARFRPVMYLIIVMESWLFGGHPLYYHLVQILWFGCLVWAIAWIAFRTVGVLAGVAILYLVASGHYWGNVWTHSLFAAEQVASLGLALVIFGYGSLASRFVECVREPIDRAILLVGIGTLICIGAKENFLPLVALNITLVAVAWRLNAVSRRFLTLSVIFVMLQLFICYGILVPNIGRSADIYGGDLRLSARILLIFHNLHFLLPPLISIGAGLAIGGWAWGNVKSLSARKNRELWVLATLLLWCGIYACWEQLFYGGALPTGNRYDFPSQLIYPVLAGAAVYGLLFLADHWPRLKVQLSPLAIQLCFALLTLNVATIYWDHGRLLPIRGAVRVSNEHTALMRADLATVRASAARHPDWPIIVMPSRPIDYEVVVTMPLWLRYGGVENRTYLLAQIGSDKVKTALDQTLAAALKKVHINGLGALFAAADVNLQSALSSGHCYIVEFEPQETQCAVLPYHPTLYYPVD